MNEAAGYNIPCRFYVVMCYGSRFTRCGLWLAIEYIHTIIHVPRCGYTSRSTSANNASYNARAI